MSARPARVDDAGIHLPVGSVVPDEAVDVRIGEHRVWSFTPGRDGTLTHGELLVAWPPALADVLDGVAKVAVAPHGGGDAVYAGTVRFGTSSRPLAIVDDAGNALSLDKGNRLQRTFDRMDDAARRELAQATRQVLDDLVDACGLDAYLVYGCLLGAVRDGRMIGHDSDADLAWLSRETHPFDIVRESRAAERILRDRGWRVVRMSAANFKVWVPMPNGKKAGIDVFGSFHIGGYFHLTASLRGRLPRESIVPFGSIDLEGVSFPAPADTDAFLAYTYGPRWRVPDPAFHFEHPPEHVRLMDQWWRGSRIRLAHWNTFYTSAEGRRVPEQPSAFARWVAERLPGQARLVDLGAGNGRDAFWFAARGHPVTALEYSGSALRRLRARNRSLGRPLLVRPVTLESTYNTLVRAAQLAHEPEPTHVYARLLVDGLEATARPNLWRFCSMAGRNGGHTFLEFRTAANVGRPTYFAEHPRTYADPDAVIAEVEAAGGRVLGRDDGRGRAVLGDEDPVVCRLDISWSPQIAARTGRDQKGASAR